MEMIRGTRVDVKIHHFLAYVRSNVCVCEL
jgi:hypothetical protein